MCETAQERLRWGHSLLSSLELTTAGERKTVDYLFSPKDGEQPHSECPGEEPSPKPNGFSEFPFRTHFSALLPLSLGFLLRSCSGEVSSEVSGEVSGKVSGEVSGEPGVGNIPLGHSGW